MELYEVIRQMRALTNASIPFSMKFVSMNSTQQVSKGERVVSKALLRTGLSKEYSKKHNSLISYVDLSDNSNKSFYIPLLTEFNSTPIK